MFKRTNQIAPVQQQQQEPALDERYGALVAADNSGIPDYKQAGFSGSEGIGADKLILPMLVLVDSSNKEFAERFPVGSIVNNVTNEFINDMPIIFLKFVEGFHICEYIAESNSENLIERVATKEELPPDTHHAKGKAYALTPDGFRVYPFIEAYCLDQHMNICRMLFKKSKYKVARRLVSKAKIEERNGPACSKVYRLSSKQELYNNHKYFNFVIEEIGPTNAEAFALACEYFENIDGYIVKGVENDQEISDN